MTETREMLILSGLPASGKSTIAKEWLAEDPSNRYRVNYDDLRLELFGPDWKFNRADEHNMQMEALKRCENALKLGCSVVIDNTNLTDKVRSRWAELGKKHGVNIVQQEVDTPLDECIKRDAARTGREHVGRAVIENMALRHGFIGPDEFYSHSNQLVIVDVDGTLANCEHRMHYLDQKWCPTCKQLRVPGVILHHTGRCDACGTELKTKKDWLSFFKECDKDTPIQPIIDLVNNLSHHHTIIVVSGRAMDLCGEKTVDWLDKHHVTYDRIFMRQAGDMREDTIVKQEILDYLPKERVKYVLDDRDSVVKMWRSNGLTCLQVAEGDF